MPPGALWAYSTVFAASFSANVPIFFLNDGDTCNIETDPGCYANYRIWLGVFSLFVVPLSCLDLREQQALQVRPHPHHPHTQPVLGCPRLLH